MKPTTDLSLIASYRRRGMPCEWIMAKMGISPETYEAACAALDGAEARLKSTGYQNLANVFTLLCHQYQLVGDSLKAMGEGLQNVVTEAEILAKLKTGTVEEQARDIASSFIILHPFTTEVVQTKPEAASPSGN